MNIAMKLRSFMGCAGLAAVASLAVCAAPSASAAQGYDYNGYNGYYAATDEDGVTVYAPRHFDRDAATGAPIERVAASRVVDYSDLDPNTRWGDHILRGRVVRAARAACNEIDMRYSDTLLDDSDAPCVRTAVRNAMYEVHGDSDY